MNVQRTAMNADTIPATTKAPVDQSLLRASRTYRIGTLDRCGVYVEIQITGRNGYPELTIVGYVSARQGSMRSVGQNQDTVREVTKFTAPWNGELTDKLLSIWHRWHLNGLHAGCEHQRALGWESKGQGYSAHPSEPCPECGYRFGTSWIHEALSQEVYDFIDTDLAAVPHVPPRY